MTDRIRDIVDPIFRRILDAGERYDERCSGGPRGLRIEFEGGCWVASWRDGPFDANRHDVADFTVMQAVERLADWLETDNASGEAA